MSKIIKPAIALVWVLLLASCAPMSRNIDPAAYQILPSDGEMVQIPSVCKSSYSTDVPRVAITAFTNNTSFGDMNAVNSNINHQGNTTTVAAGAAGIMPTPMGVGVGYAGVKNSNTVSHTQVDTFYRKISPKLGEYAQAAVENTISKIGGATVYDRKKTDQILNEQKFQMTIGDPSTAVQLGKIAGVQYIITGTVDNISAQYIGKIETNNNIQGNLGAFLSVASMAANTQSGWNVYVEMTVSMIDVATGEVILSEKVKGHQNAGEARNFNAESTLNAAKLAMGMAVDDIKPAFSEKLAQKGYIQQLRGDKKIALINVGSAKGLTAGEKLDAYDFIVVSDPFTNASTCNISKIPADIIVSDQVQPNASWVVIDAKKEVLPRIKIGTIIIRRKLSGQNIIQKMGGPNIFNSMFR